MSTNNPPAIQPPVGGWPDSLEAPDTPYVQQLLTGFWAILARLPDLFARSEIVLLHTAIAELRRQIAAMMLAANGIRYPDDTRRLNLYLGESQRIALEKTVDLPPSESLETTRRESPLAQALALVVIYQWYAPQLYRTYGAQIPSTTQSRILAHLHATVPFWPATIHTDSADFSAPAESVEPLDRTLDRTPGSDVSA